MSEDAQKFHALLCQQLVARGVEAFTDASGVRLRNWPAARIQVSQFSRESDQFVYIMLWFTLDERRPEDAIFSEVRLGVAPYYDIANVLRSFPLPVPEKPDGIISVRQFLFCMRAEHEE